MKQEIEISNRMYNETIGNNVIIHSDFLIDKNISQTETNVTLLLQSLPQQLQQLVKDDYDFYMISEDNICEYLENQVLAESGTEDATYQECNEYFLNVLYPTFELYFPDSFNEDFTPKNNIVREIAEFAAKNLIDNAKIIINNKRIIIDTLESNEFSMNVHNVNWVQMYVDNN